MSAPAVPRPGAWRALRSNRPALVSLAFLAFLSVLALLAPLLPLAPPGALDLQRQTLPPELRLGDREWPHRVSLHLALAEPLASAETLARLDRTLNRIVEPIARAEATVVMHRAEGRVERVEVVLPYRRRFDPTHGSDLEQRIASELASRTVDGRLRLRGGGDLEVAFEGLRARDGYGPLNALDRALLRAREGLFGHFQLGPWLGTDTKGRDLLARSLFGSRVSLAVALAGALVSVLVGVVYGAVSGYFGGRTDERMMRLVDVLYSIPFLFVVIFVITILNEYRAELAAVGVGRLTAFFVVLGLVTWLTMARVVRGQVLALRNQEFVQAARVMGASHARILAVHVLPHLAGVVVVYLTLTLPSVMLYEAFLSFLGLGVEAPRVSWGLLAADAIDALNPLMSAWWLVAAPAVFMGATLLALNVLGDGLRDALDPRLGGRQ